MLKASTIARAISRQAFAVGAVGTLALCGSAMAQTVVFSSSSASWSAATTNAALVATFSEAMWPVNAVLPGNWSLNGVTYSGHAGTPVPNIYVFANSPLEGNALTANGDEDIDLAFNPARTAFAFDVSVNPFGPVTVTVFDTSGLQIGSSIVAANTFGFMGCTSSVPIGRVNYRSVNGAIVNSLLDNVRLADCPSPPVIVRQPSSTNTCPGGSAMFTVIADSIGAAAITYQWQWQPGQVGTWVDLVEGINTHAGQAALDVNGATDATVRPRVLWGIGGNLPLRCMVTNACGSVSSHVVSLTVCAADFNCDTVVDFNDYLDFVDAFSTQTAGADFNNDTIIDFNDYLDFVDALSQGC